MLKIDGHLKRNLYKYKQFLVLNAVERASRVPQFQLLMG